MIGDIILWGLIFFIFYKLGRSKRSKYEFTKRNIVRLEKENAWLDGFLSRYEDSGEPIPSRKALRRLSAISSLNTGRKKDSESI